jgi:hypothetical protein
MKNKGFCSCPPPAYPGDVLGVCGDCGKPFKTASSTAKPVGNGNLKPFKKGYDPRRWLSGRGKKSPEQREGEEILRAVIWEELSREFDMATMKPTETAETVDALRLMVRTWIKKNPAAVAERIAGKVTDRVDVTSGNKPIGWKEFINGSDGDTGTDSQ